MRIHKKAGVICLAALLVLGYNVFFMSKTIVEDQSAATNFFIGFIGGMAWLLAALFDLKSNHSIKKNEGEAK